MNIQKLQRSALFRNLGEEEIREALEELTWYEKKYEKDELILRAGDAVNTIAFVEAGSVTIENNDLWGNRTILNIAQTGQFFAESYAMLRDAVLLVDVRANEACEILFVRIDALRDDPVMTATLCRWKALMLRNLLQISTRKNLILSERSFHTAPKSARARIMAFLYAESLKMHADEFEIPFDRQQMADYLNLDRTALSKELGKMKKDGMINYRKNSFQLLKRND